MLNWAFPFVCLLIMNTFIIHTLRKRLKVNISTTEGQGQVQGQNFKMKKFRETGIYTATFSHIWISYSNNTYVCTLGVHKVV